MQNMEQLNLMTDMNESVDAMSLFGMMVGLKNSGDESAPRPRPPKKPKQPK